jgi:hypothetical protein
VCALYTRKKEEGRAPAARARREVAERALKMEEGRKKRWKRKNNDVDRRDMCRKSGKYSVEERF